MVDYIEGYRQGYRDALRDLANRGVISQAAPETFMAMPPSMRANAMSQAVEVAATTPPTQRARRKRRKDPKLSAAFKEANARLRTKSGKLRKGKTQADVARLAQRLRKKM